jgi:hypothetical protein
MKSRSTSAFLLQGGAWMSSEKSTIGRDGDATLTVRTFY